MTRPIGIDLGTTFCAIATIDDTGRSVVLHNSDGQTITPSVVLFEGSDALVGQQAKLQRAAFPDDIVEFVKRQMGNPTWRHFDRNGVEHTPESISAIILKRLTADASLVLNEPVNKVVITVPAYFDETQRNATRQAGTIAGLEVLSVINEPTAAAVSFGVDRGFAGTVLVYDLGGGTFDVTLLRMGDSQFDIVATDGDRNLGGYDFDNAIIQWAQSEFERVTGARLETDTDLAQLRDRAEQAKHRLSVSAEAPIFASSDGHSTKLVLTREVFEKLTEPLLVRTEMLVEDVLEAAGVTSKGVDKVLLVGGSTRMPMVAQMVTRVMGAVPDQSIHPDEAVARGAAIIADMRLAEAGDQTGRSAAGGPIAVRDVVSHGLGVVTQDADTGRMVNSIIIPANSTIPCQQVQVYYTVVDQQTELRVQVTEGDETDLKYTKQLGESTLTIPPYPAEAPVGVIFSCDIDGILHIEVVDETAKRSLGEFEIERIHNLDASQLDQLRDALTRLEVQ